MTNFIRDRFTWLAYLMLAYYAYMLSGLGPLMPYLRAELNLSYSVAALHTSAFAVGMILAGVVGSAATERLGRGRLLWLGGAGMAAGASVLMASAHPALTVGGVFVMGFIGSFITVVVPASLSDRHGRQRAIALTESNVAASVTSALVPLAIALGVSSGIGWRLGPTLGIVALALVAVFFRGTVVAPGKRVATDAPARKLPRRFWAYWLVMVFSVSLEWCLGFWGADFLENSVGLEKVAATSLMSVFFVAMLIGRIIGSRLTRRFESRRLLAYAIVVVCAGFPVFWLAQAAVLNVVGLFVAGLGIANLFPLTLAVATSIDPQQINRASARISMASGVAILVAPQVLASFADQVGIYNAFGVAAALLLAAALIVFAERRRAPVATGI